MLFSPKTALRLTALFLIPCLVLDPALAAGSSLFNRAASRAVSDGKSVSRLQIDAFTTPLAIAPLHDVLHPIPVEGVVPVHTRAVLALKSLKLPSGASFFLRIARIPTIMFLFESLAKADHFFRNASGQLMVHVDPWTNGSIDGTRSGVGWWIQKAMRASGHMTRKQAKWDTDSLVNQFNKHVIDPSLDKIADPQQLPTGDYVVNHGISQMPDAQKWLLEHHGTPIPAEVPPAVPAPPIQNILPSNPTPLPGTTSTNQKPIENLLQPTRSEPLHAYQFSDYMHQIYSGITTHPFISLAVVALMLTGVLVTRYYLNRQRITGKQRLFFMAVGGLVAPMIAFGALAAPQAGIALALMVMARTHAMTYIWRWVDSRIIIPFRFWTFSMPQSLSPSRLWIPVGRNLSRFKALAHDPKIRRRTAIVGAGLVAVGGVTVLVRYFNFSYSSILGFSAKALGAIAFVAVARYAAPKIKTQTLVYREQIKKTLEDRRVKANQKALEGRQQKMAAAFLRLETISQYAATIPHEMLNFYISELQHMRTFDDQALEERRKEVLQQLNALVKTRPAEIPVSITPSVMPGALGSLVQSTDKKMVFFVAVNRHDLDTILMKGWSTPSVLSFMLNNLPSHPLNAESQIKKAVGECLLVMEFAKSDLKKTGKNQLDEQLLELLKSAPKQWQFLPAITNPRLRRLLRPLDHTRFASPLITVSPPHIAGYVDKTTMQFVPNAHARGFVIKQLQFLLQLIGDRQEARRVAEEKAITEFINLGDRLNQITTQSGNAPALLMALQNDLTQWISNHATLTRENPAGWTDLVQNLQADIASRLTQANEADAAVKVKEAQRLEGARQELDALVKQGEKLKGIKDLQELRKTLISWHVKNKLPELKVVYEQGLEALQQRIIDATMQEHAEAVHSQKLERLNLLIAEGASLTSSTALQEFILTFKAQEKLFVPSSVQSNYYAASKDLEERLTRAIENEFLAFVEHSKTLEQATELEEYMKQLHTWRLAHPSANLTSIYMAALQDAEERHGNALSHQDLATILKEASAGLTHIVSQLKTAEFAKSQEHLVRLINALSRGLAKLHTLPNKTQVTYFETLLTTANQTLIDLFKTQLTTQRGVHDLHALDALVSAIALCASEESLARFAFAPDLVNYWKDLLQEAGDAVTLELELRSDQRTQQIAELETMERNLSQRLPPLEMIVPAIQRLPHLQQEIQSYQDPALTRRAEDLLERANALRWLVNRRHQLTANTSWTLATLTNERDYFKKWQQDHLTICERYNNVAHLYDSLIHFIVLYQMQIYAHDNLFELTEQTLGEWNKTQADLRDKFKEDDVFLHVLDETHRVVTVQSALAAQFNDLKNRIGMLGTVEAEHRLSAAQECSGDLNQLIPLIELNEKGAQETFKQECASLRLQIETASTHVPQPSAKPEHQDLRTALQFIATQLNGSNDVRAYVQALQSLEGLKKDVENSRDEDLILKFNDRLRNVLGRGLQNLELRITELTNTALENRTEKIEATLSDLSMLRTAYQALQVSLWPEYENLLDLQLKRIASAAIPVVVAILKTFTTIIQGTPVNQFNGNQLAEWEKISIQSQVWKELGVQEAVEVKNARAEFDNARNKAVLIVASLEKAEQFIGRLRDLNPEDITPELFMAIKTEGKGLAEALRQINATDETVKKMRLRLSKEVNAVRIKQAAHFMISNTSGYDEYELFLKRLIAKDKEAFTFPWWNDFSKQFNEIDQMLKSESDRPAALQFFEHIKPYYSETIAHPFMMWLQRQGIDVLAYNKQSATQLFELLSLFLPGVTLSMANVVIDAARELFSNTTPVNEKLLESLRLAPWTPKSGFTTVETSALTRRKPIDVLAQGSVWITMGSNQSKYSYKLTLVGPQIRVDRYHNQNLMANYPHLLPAKRPVVFGREEGAIITPDDKAMSRLQCAVSMEAQGEFIHVVVTDEQSGNGTALSYRKAEQVKNNEDRSTAQTDAKRFSPNPYTYEDAFNSALEKGDVNAAEVALRKYELSGTATMYDAKPLKEKLAALKKSIPTNGTKKPSIWSRLFRTNGRSTHPHRTQA